jgi:hypothetical protein
MKALPVTAEKHSLFISMIHIKPVNVYVLQYIRVYTDNCLLVPPILAGKVEGVCQSRPICWKNQEKFLENACIFNAKSINRNMRKIAQ